MWLMVARAASEPVLAVVSSQAWGNVGRCVAMLELDDSSAILKITGPYLKTEFRREFRELMKYDRVTPRGTSVPLLR